MKVSNGKILRLLLKKGVMNGNTIKRAISRSKIRKRIATRKNRKEKGSRADFMGSKPHS